MKTDPGIPLIGFAAYSGTGKTTLLVKILSILKAKEIRVGVIKHAHHSFDIDHPGKDSYRLREAGARQVLVGSRKRWALMVEAETEYTLDYFLQNLHPQDLDLIMVEGFKSEPFPKIEIHRPSLDRPLLSDHDKSIIAIATDDQSTLVTTLPVFDMNHPEKIVEFIIKQFINRQKPLAEACDAGSAT